MMWQDSLFIYFKNTKYFNTHIRRGENVIKKPTMIYVWHCDTQAQVGLGSLINSVANGINLST